MLVKIESYTSPQVVLNQNLQGRNLLFCWSGKFRKNPNTGTPHFVVFHFSVPYICGVLTNWRENHPSVERSHPAFLWGLLYFGGLELNLQYVWGTTIVYMQVIGKECLGKEGSAGSRELGYYSMVPPNTKMPLTFQWWCKNMTELCL